MVFLIHKKFIGPTMLYQLEQMEELYHNMFVIHLQKQMNRIYGKMFEYKEDAIKYIDDFKIKWETGSNQTVQEKRDKKLGDILDEK